MWHVVMFSAGIGSWAAGMRVAEKHGTEKLVLLFTDVKDKLDQHPHRGEDQDAYRFLVEGAQVIGGRLEWISRGKHIWQVFTDSRYMSNSRVDHCSHQLKRTMAREWVKEHFKPDEVTLYLGIDWTEIHRCASIERNWHPYKVEFPMCERPHLSRGEMFRWVESLGVKRPRLYDLGFAHNNCGGFCVKAGLGHFHHLLKTIPERYAYHEARQEELFAVIGKRVPFLRQIVNGQARYLSLKEFRERVEADNQVDMFDLGGCGCFTDSE